MAMCRQGLGSSRAECIRGHSPLPGPPIGRPPGRWVTACEFLPLDLQGEVPFTWRCVSGPRGDGGGARGGDLPSLGFSRPSPVEPALGLASAPRSEECYVLYVGRPGTLLCPAWSHPELGSGTSGVG